jgi:hypothetical protein
MFSSQSIEEHSGKKEKSEKRSERAWQQERFWKLITKELHS